MFCKEIYQEGDEDEVVVEARVSDDSLTRSIN